MKFKHRREERSRQSKAFREWLREQRAKGKESPGSTGDMQHFSHMMWFYVDIRHGVGGVAMSFPFDVYILRIIRMIYHAANPYILIEVTHLTWQAPWPTPRRAQSKRSSEAE